MTMTMTMTTEQLSSTPDTTAGLQSVPVPDDTSCRAARQAIEAYGRRQSSGSEHNDLAVGAERVRAVTEQFAGNLLVDKEGRPLREVYDLALLCDVVDCLVDESCPDEDRTQAAVQIINYLTQPQLSGDGSEQPARPMLDQAHFDRTIQFMADLSVISQGVDHHRQAVLADIADEAQRRRLSQPGGEQSFGRLDPDDWRLPTRLISLEHLYKEIVKKTNLEALIPKAAVVLDRLRNPSADAVSTWHDCMEAETVYAPLCELLGLDGMAMDLRSQAIQLRLMGSSGGKPSSLEIAEQIYQELRKTDMQELLAHLFDEELAVQYSVGPAPDGEEQIIFGEARSDDIRMVFRIKSIGSLAEKLSRDTPPSGWSDWL